jgi:hypothetical protein
MGLVTGTGWVVDGVVVFVWREGGRLRYHWILYRDLVLEGEGELKGTREGEERRAEEGRRCWDLCLRISSGWKWNWRGIYRKGSNGLVCSGRGPL